jgi:hypothetical protein
MDNDEDNSSDSESDILQKRKLLLGHFVPADDSENFEFVNDPISDDDEDYDRYDRSIELQLMEPMARVDRAYSIREYDGPRKREELKDGKWKCNIFDGDKTYEGVDQSMSIAYHLAAIHFMKALIKENERWMTQFGLPNDRPRCYQILDRKFEELKLKSHEIEEIGGQNPISFLNEFCSFYKSKAVIKQPLFECKENENSNAAKRLFSCTGTFRGQEFIEVKPSKQEAKTEVARKFIQKLKEKDEIRPFLEDRTILKRGKFFVDHINYSECETRKNFDKYFQDDPYHYATICNGSEPDIKKFDGGITITARGHSASFEIPSTESEEDIKQRWATIFLRKAFTDQFAPEFFEKHLPQEMINSVNEVCHKITVPEPWENEKR